jgi:hypothetical protein
MKTLRSKKMAWLVPGIILGCLIGLNLRSFLPSVPLHASATDGFENFSIATGLIDNRIEGLFFLDYVTGQLKCAVINPKTGKFNAFFARDVASDFGGAAQSEAKYLMVTGLADMSRGRSSFQVGRTLVYIADTTSGQVAVYGVPWSSSAQAAGKTQTSELVPLELKAFRDASLVRD